jgi:hypothetical protein
MPTEADPRLLVELRRRQAEAPCDALLDRAGEAGEVARAGAQRRHAQARHVEPVVEIRAKASGGDLLAQVAVRRGDDPRRHAQRRAAADALEGPLLEHAQQHRLERGIEIADLVEEDRAAARLLEASGARRHRSGERTALVPEELALEERARQRRAVRVDERCVPTLREPVQRPGCDTLAGAGLAGDEHRGIERGQRRDLPAQRAHRGAFAHERALDLFAAVSSVLHLPSSLRASMGARAPAGFQTRTSARAQESRGPVADSRRVRRAATERRGEPGASTPVLDPFTVVTLTAALVVVGIAAGVAPALRASQVPPAEALRGV